MGEAMPSRLIGVGLSWLGQVEVSIAVEAV
jgi:hypothetical protein